VNHDRWLVSYADFITLLFAFFVVLFASAQVDRHKVGRLAIAIQVAFKELGVFPASGAENPLIVDEPVPLSTLQSIANAKRGTQTPSSPPVADSPDPTSDDETNLAVLQEELQQALQHEIATHTVALHRETEGLVISLREFGFFDSGSASLRSSAVPALDRIASILAVRTCKLRIEGHTDNVPIHTSQMATNWELSTARATEMVRLLIQHYGFSPQRLSAAGYAQYHPIASNDTLQGRAQNRRVDLVILKEHIVRPSISSVSKSSPAVQ
jgi:chemotaxis protein MotB